MHLRRSIAMTGFAALAAPAIAAADLIEVTPITDRIIALRIEEGTVSRAVGGQPVDADVLTVSPLATGALAAGAFRIASGQHAAYAGNPPVAALHRKTKGGAFANTQDNWQFDGPRGAGYYPAGRTWADSHWLYLTLPTALQRGSTYTITWDAEALNLAGGAVSFSAADETLRSEAIHLNTLGFLPDATRKYAYIYHWAGSLDGIDFGAWAGRTFRVIDADGGATRFTGTVAFRASAANPETGQGGATPNDNFLGAAVWECDFSALDTPGEYRVVVDGIGCSYPFRIAADVYAQPFRVVMNSLYQNRSGIALVAPWTDEPRSAPHHPGVTPGFAGRLKYTTFRGCDMENQDSGSPADKAAIEAGARGALAATWGWYQDAGDWDGYITHTAVPIQLALLYLSWPDRFGDGQLRLPESANGVPDVLDEAAWLPRYFRRQRQELLVKGWGSGGVGGRVFGDAWGEDTPGGIRRGSWQDVDRDWFITGEDPFTTYRYAASAALLAAALQRAGRTDPEGVDWGSEAVAAYAWAVANTRPGDTVKDYAGSLIGHRILAAAALYRLTGAASYHDDLLAATSGMDAASELQDSTWWACWSYLTMPANRPVDPARAASLRSAVDASTDPWVISASNRGLRWSGNWWFPAQIGQATTPMVLPLMVADRLRRASAPSSAEGFRAMVQTTCDYLLGGNPLHTTWMTGIGPRPVRGIFHMDDWALGRQDRAGLIPYGPTRIDTLWFWWPTEIPASPIWAYKTAYPALSDVRTGSPPVYYGAPGNWPLHEVWFDQAYAPQTCEFTVHQTQIAAAVAYGYLLPTFAEADTAAPPTPGAPSTSAFNDPSPVLSGTTEPGATVRIYADGRLIGTVAAGAGGAWSWTVAPALPPGRHAVTVQAIDAAYNASGMSPALRIDVPGAPPGPGGAQVLGGGDGGGGACGSGTVSAVMTGSLLGMAFIRRRRKRM